MRKRLTALAAVLGAVGVLVLGFYLPRAVSSALDRHLAGERRELAVQDVSLSKPGEADIYDMLRLIGGAHTEVELSQGEGMTAGGAAGQAEELAHGLFPGIWGERATASGDIRAVPVLCTSREEPLLSGIFWRCTWANVWGAVNTLYLEDRGGRLACARLHSPYWNFKPGTVLYLNEVVSGLAYYCQDAYEAEAFMSGPLGILPPMEGDGSINLIWPGAAEYTLPLRYEGEWFSVNEAVSSDAGAGNAATGKNDAGKMPPRSKSVAGARYDDSINT